MASDKKKPITLFPLIMIAVGSCIGSGIFISPSDVASQLANGYQVLIVWLIGGVVALTGALTFGELASRFPGTGGVYTYLKEAYGDFVAFLYGWSCLTVITSGAIAALCLAFARYIVIVFGLDISSHLTIGLLALFVVTTINIFSVKWSALFSSFITVLKVAGIGMIILVCLIYSGQTFQDFSLGHAQTHQVSFGLALIGVIWSYGGWQHASYMGGSVQNAKEVLPKGMVFGALIVTVVYILVNLAYLSVLSIEEVSSSTAVATDALLKISTAGAIVVAILVALSTFGTVSVYTLTAPWVYFKMGEDKVFFSWMSDIHGVYGTPVKAILVQGFWSAFLMILWGTFESLVTYVVFMDWIFMTLVAASVFLFRKKLGKPAGSDYKVALYPWVPLVFISISAWFLISTLIGRPEQAIGGIVLVLIGLPFYLNFKRKRKAIHQIQENDLN